MMEIIDIKALLDYYNKELYPIFNKHNSSYYKSIFILEKDIIILTKSTYEDSYENDINCTRITLIELDDNNNYKYYYYNSINVLPDHWEDFDIESFPDYYLGEFYAHKIKIEENEMVNILLKCIDYYDDIQGITLYDQYNDPIYKNFIKKKAVIDIIYSNIINNTTLTNTKKTIKVFEILLPFINLLTNNNILFDFEKFYIMEYDNPVLIFENNDKSILVKIINFENCEDKIVDLRTNNNPLEHIIAYHNNKKAIISNTMTQELLIDEMIKNDIYAKELMNIIYR